MSGLRRAVKEDLDRIKIDRLLARIKELEAELAAQLAANQILADMDAKTYAENQRLRDMIINFCQHHRWAVDVWKNQKHIKPLFDEALLGGGENG